MTPEIPISRNQPSQRSFAKLTQQHLSRLASLASQDREMFLRAQPAFRGLHLATVLAQGAAMHWLDGKNGIKDLDVWSFFVLPKGVDRFPADRRKRHVDFGTSELGRQTYDFQTAQNARDLSNYRRWEAFTGRRVDLMMRGLPCRMDDDPADAIRAWLRSGQRKRQSSPWWLSQKAVVFIDPKDFRGDVIWPM